MSDQEKIEGLYQYREALDEEDRKVFDTLIGYAWELAN
jgi:hypothetical protein